MMLLLYFSLLFSFHCSSLLFPLHCSCSSPSSSLPPSLLSFRDWIVAVVVLFYTNTLSHLSFLASPVPPSFRSGLLGDDPTGRPNNLLPVIQEVLTGKREKLSIYGDDYNTVDGTGVRDYIHVVDLAKAHVVAMEGVLREGDSSVERRLRRYNVGSGKGSSVLQLKEAMERVSGRTIPSVKVERRVGDLGEVVADPSLMARELGFKAELGIDRMCEDSWRFMSNWLRSKDSSSVSQ